jgi:hypothetical protein
LRACAVVTLPDKLSRTLGQWCGDPPAMLSCESAYWGKQQALREEEWQYCDRFCQLVEHIDDPRGASAETRAYRMTTAPRKPIRKINNGLVGPRFRRPDGEEQHRTVVVDVGFVHAFDEQSGDVVTGAQDVGDDQLQGHRLGGITYRLGNIDGGVIRLSEEQGHHDCRLMAGVGKLPGSRAEIRLCQVKVGGHRGNLCLLGDGGHQSLDTETALGMPAAVGEADQREIGMAQRAQRVSRCAVWVLQRGQNFFSSRRSGSLRRFFLVM